MTISAGKLVESAMKHGCDSTHIYTPEQMPEFWKAIQAPVLAHERGAGFYCWKPAIILDAILKMEVNSILIYADAGQEIISNVREIIGRMEDDMMLFSNCWPHVEWTKMDVLDAINKASFVETKTMNGSYYAVSDDLANAQQVQASLIFIRITERSINFFKEWFSWSLMPSLIDNSPSKIPNVSTFAESRWDQSLISSMAIKMKLKLHWFPSTTFMNKRVEFPNDTYPPLVVHHRKRNAEW